MLTYRVANTTDKSVVIDGLGVLEPKETREFTSDEAASFAFQSGVKLLQTNVREGVEVTVVSTAAEGEEE